MNMSVSLQNAETIAVVTGGAQGVGYAVAERLLAEGCRAIALAGRDKQKGAKAVDRLRAQNDSANVIFIETDMRNTAACQNLIHKAIAHFGTINTLVNAAAMSNRGTLTETTLETWDMLMETNVRGPFFLMQHFVRHALSEQKAASIVNVLSQCVHCGQSYLSAYSASKGALATLTRNVANAYRYNQIRCNAVLPGWMDTPGEDITQRKYHGAQDGWLEKAAAAQPMQQLADPKQMAILIAYLLSPHSGIITGALIDYDQNVLGAITE